MMAFVSRVEEKGALGKMNDMGKDMQVKMSMASSWNQGGWFDGALGTEVANKVEH